MRPYDPNTPLISIHIPKCGGTSFNEVLTTWFGRRLLLHYSEDKDDTLPPRRRLRRWFGSGWRPRVCVHGHFNASRGFGPQDYYPQINQFITFLRDPLEIMASNFFFVRRLGDQSYRRGQRHSLDEKYDGPLDYLVRHPLFMMQFFPAEMNLDNYRSILEERFVYVGITEDMQTSVNVLAKRLGLQPVQIAERNVSPRDFEIPAWLKEQYRQQYPLEYAIYDYTRDTYNS